MPRTLTRGVDHVGLVVRDLKKTCAFFTNVLGYEALGEDPNYPAAFLSDGTTMLTFWQCQGTEPPNVFDRRKNLGLHHLAIAIDPEALDPLYETLKKTPDCIIEFAPELSYGGPRRHMVCYLPGSGIRVEFIQARPS